MRPTTPFVLVLFTAGMTLVACEESPSPGDRTSSSSASIPVAPSRAPVALPSARRGGDGSGELLAARELDPFSLPADYHAASGPLTPSTTTLPVDETYGGNAGWAFRITQEGSGNGGWFRVRSMTSTNRMALLATHTGEGIAARAINTGQGRALWSQIQNPGNPFPSLVATTVGSGEAIEAINFGSGPAGVFDVRGGGGDAVSAVTTGSGSAGVFEISNGSSTNSALEVETNGSGGQAGLFEVVSGSGADGLRSNVFGTGSAGLFSTINTSNTATTLFVQQTGLGRAGRFRSLNPSNTEPALEVEASGEGPGFLSTTDHDGFSNADAVRGIVQGTRGSAAVFRITNASNISDGLIVETMGTGSAAVIDAPSAVDAVVSVEGGGAFSFPRGEVIRARNTGTSGRAAGLESGSGDGVLLIQQTGGSGTALTTRLDPFTTGDFAVFQIGTSNSIRFDRTGKGFFNGGTQNSGADLAEAIEVIGHPSAYEPGDVLAISPEAIRRVERSAGVYSTRVIGVYATRPGVLLTDTPVDDPMGDRVPVAVVGIVPTKVSGENGPIRPGDLLVTSSRPGTAMRATESRIRHGSVLGKAMEPFDGPGAGTILVMVNAK